MGNTSPLSVGIVGAGRVGAALGAALAAAGHQIIAASGRSAASRTRIAELLPTAAVRPAEEVAAGTRLVIVSVPDDALTPLIADLAEAGALGPDQIVAHTSGAHGLGALAPAVVAGAGPLALHPAMTFTGTRLDLDRLRSGVSFGVTAPVDLRAFATRIVADLGGAVEWIPEERRALYHAALAHGSNHLVTLVNEAMDRLRDAGVTDPARVLDPLLHAALDNTLRLGDAALTGPVSRGDAGTVARHLADLGASAPESVPAYLALARRTADRAVAAGRLLPADAEQLLDVLAHNRLAHNRLAHDCEEATA
ncbi:DUF2520 domain-containing protein [Planosporangium flavigriseum]|uniref:DUF2520 domain-containing protein n=1 Tax=Planosporangium flavigriseum TaxID=373681 RepID=A0A8J3PM06_9ACTN|nr:DUF2520 domain-containing protein [Planosporangium flavigriseum]NJC64284.1 DUF2520 domain-containing protein [Planosporangium flavigriseum]GIG73804.1 hypothetical protein Pfl04_22080 [Planosporangium flavigriseum]